jgi:predicted ribosome quality control (RQC) complex YloA/Tae2 family protein
MRELLSPNGHAIFIGQNARENETISFEMARADDHWFHAENAAGAHVLLRGSNVLPIDIKCAAIMAAKYSKTKTKTCDVIHVRGADVERPKRASRGTVHIASDAEVDIICMRNYA